MASENETFDEVMRCMQNDIVHFVGKPVKHSRDLLQEYHDRFEVGLEATREKSSQVGNSAKMRDALSDACYAMFNFLKTQNGGYEEMAKALDKAKAALAATPRNCDIGTALEQVSRHRIWCKCGGDCAVSCKMCFAKWSQMPYEEGGATNEDT